MLCAVHLAVYFFDITAVLTVLLPTNMFDLDLDTVAQLWRPGRPV